MLYEIPKNPGLDALPKDNRDILYSKVFGIEKDIPRKFRRPLPVGLTIPYQKQVPSCVSCCESFINQYKSRVNEGNEIELSWRKVHADTGTYGTGRHLRAVAKYLQNKGQPEVSFCPNDAGLSESEFMQANLLPVGIANALRRRIGAYSFVNDGDLNELCSAIIKEPIVGSLGGVNEDWRKPFSEVIKQTASPKWWHSIGLWDYDLDEGWIGIRNWWGDNYRRISIDYKLTGSISFEDLPDGENKNMLKSVQATGDVDIYIIVENKKYLLPDSDTQRYYLYDLKILLPTIEITQTELAQYEEGEKIPSIKLMRAIEPIAKDIFLKNEV